MKKLIAMIGAVAMSFGLFADAIEFTTSVRSSLDGRTVGDTQVVGVNDAGTGIDNIHWWDTNYLTVVDYEQPATVSEDGDDKKYLKLETSDSPLLRTFDKVVLTGTPASSATYSKINIADHGVFIDTKVRMTAHGEDPALGSGDDSKLLVWLKAVEDDPETTEVDEGVTNLMVTCGYPQVSGELTPTNYVLTVEGESIKADDWVNLLIRADNSTNSDNIARFKIFVNEKPAIAVGQGESGGNISEFPSIIGGNIGDQTLEAAGYKGNGDVSYVNLLTADDAPAYAADPTTVAITWGDHVASVTIGGIAVDPAVPYNVTAFGENITATIAYEEGYRRASVTPTGFADECFTEDPANNQFTFKVARYANAAVVIEAELDADIADVTVDDTPVTKSFSSMAAIFDYLAGLEPTPGAARIALKGNLASQGFMTPDEIADTEITIDLKGFTLTGVADPDAATGYDYVVLNAGTMKIVDTVGGGQIATGTSADGIIYNVGGNVLTLGTSDIKYDGVITNEVYDFDVHHIVGELRILDGKFKPSKVEGEGVKIPDDKKWSDNRDAYGYFTLVDKEQPVPGTFNVKFEDAEDCSATITPAAGTSNFVAGTVIAVIATPATDYEYAAASYEGWELQTDGTLTTNVTVTAAATFTAPAATRQTVTVTLPTVTIDGVSSLVVSQKVNEVWEEMTSTPLKIGVGNEYVVVAIPAADYRASNPITNGTAAVGTPITVTEQQVKDKVSEINYVAQVDNTKYETLAEAVAVDGEVTLLKDVTLTETLTINKAKALNLAGKTITFGDALTQGIKITVDGVAITNGTIASSLTANAAMSKAIEVAYANATFKDLTINAGHYEYAIYANCDEEAAKEGRSTQSEQLAWIYALTSFKKLDCDSVTITGNGSLFHVEGMEATLNNCSAAGSSSDLFANAAHQAAVYSAVNARTTITGSGTYTHVNALQSGNLGGKITVAEGSTATFTGNIKSYMKVGAHTELENVDAYKADFKFNAGVYTGSIVFEDANARTLDSFTKGATVTIAAPEGYIWFNDTKLGKPIIATFKVDGAVYAAETNIVAFTPQTPDIPSKTGHTAAWNPEVTQISESKEFNAVYTPIQYTITYKMPDGETAFTAWTNDYTAPATFTVAATVTLPTEANVDLGDGGTFKGWTNEVGEVTNTAGLTADLVVFANIEKVVDPVIDEITEEVDTTNVPGEKAQDLYNNMKEINTACGDIDKAKAWIATVYGEGNKIPGEKLANASADNVKLAVANDLPITANEPTFAVSASTVSADTNVAAFEFTLKDGTTEVEIKTITDKVKAMVRYTADLKTTFGQAVADTDVAISLTEGTGTAGKIKVELIKKNDVNAGFMKVEPQQPVTP